MDPGSLLVGSCVLECAGLKWRLRPGLGLGLRTETGGPLGPGS